MMSHVATPTVPSARAWQWVLPVRKALTVVHAICGIGWLDIFEGRLSADGRTMYGPPGEIH